MNFRPMLSATLKDDNRDQVWFPLIGSPKLDGIRCLIHPEGGPVSRNYKPIPNDFMRGLLSLPSLVGFDGELILSKDPKQFTFNDVQSAVMSKAGTPNFYFAIFDNFNQPELGWGERHGNAEYADLGPVHFLPHIRLSNWEQVDLFENRMVAAGYEGIMLRHEDSPYKFGRSTMREQYLMKFKRYEDHEGVVTGFVERLHNENPLEEDAYGLAKRSSHKENLTGSGTLGKLILETPEWGEVNVGTGFTDAHRSIIWNNQNLYLGRTVTFKHEPVLKDKPRFPVFLRFREEE